MSRSVELIERDHVAVAPAIYRGTHIAFQKGSGVYLYDFEGRKYLDFVAGIATMNVGHCHPAVVEAICEQARRLVHAACHVGYMEPYTDMLEAIKAVAPGHLHEGKGILMNSGSEAVETALKLARYATGRPMIVAFTHSFHGRSMGALAATASNTIYREHLSGLMTGVVHSPYPYCYRCPLGHSSREMCGMACLGLVEKALETLIPPQDLAGVLVEPIAGEGGYLVPPDGFLQGLEAICHRHDALLIVDEVQTGLGRTGHMFAVEHWGVVPDIVCLAKALGGGLPLGAILARSDLVDAWPPAAHGTTFGGNPVACRAGLATLRIVQEENLMAHAVAVGNHIQTLFRKAQKELPIIGDVRGRGLMIGIELIQGGGSPAGEVTKAVIKDAETNGVILTKCGANTLRFAPPLIITPDQASEGVAVVLKALGHYQW